jgi:hypothetical protein
VAPCSLTSCVSETSAVVSRAPLICHLSETQHCHDATMNVESLKLTWYNILAAFSTPQEFEHRAYKKVRDGLCIL